MPDTAPDILAKLQAAWTAPAAAAPEFPPSDESAADESDNVELLDADAVGVCAACGRFNSWQSALGVWRCEVCDPPWQTKFRQSNHAR